MCDIYNAECEIEECNNTVNVHIADYKYPRDRFKVWCKKHIDRATLGAIQFIPIKNSYSDYETSCAILGPEVGMIKGNSPNWGCEAEEIEVME